MDCHSDDSSDSNECKCDCIYNPRTAGGFVYIATGIEKPGVTYVTNPAEMGLPISPEVQAWLVAPAAANDRLVSVDAVKGKIIGQAVLPNNLSGTPPIDGQNNEPHHIGFINNEKGVVFGGLLSVVHNILTGGTFQNSFKINVEDPYHPFFIGGDAVYGSATDEYYSTFNGNYLLAMMGSPDAISPGNITVFDSSNNILGNFSGGMGIGDEFYPHGVSYDPASDTLITSDFVQPLSAVIGTKTGNLIFGRAVRVWNNFYEKFKNSVPTVDLTIPVPADVDVGGLISVIFIPGNSKRWAIASARGILFLVKPDLGIMVKILGYPANLAGYLTMNRGGTRILLPMLEDFAYIDITDPERPIIADVISLKKYQCGDYQWRIPVGAHYSGFSLDEKYAYATDYFLSTPVIHDMGDKKLWRARAECDSFTNDHSFEVDFNTALKSTETDLQQRGIPIGTTLPGHPHGFMVGQASSQQVSDSNNIVPQLSCRSPSKISCITKKQLNRALSQSIESWLLNAASALVLAKEIAANPTVVPYPPYRSLINSCNAIGVAYGKIYGKEIGSTIIKACFYVGTQFLKYATDVLDNIFGAVDTEYDLALLYKRGEELANVLSTTFNADYNTTFNKVNKYIDALINWVNGLNGSTVSTNALVQAYKLAIFLANNIKKMANLPDKCIDNHNNKSHTYNGFYIFSYCFWINIGQYELASNLVGKIVNKHFDNDDYALEIFDKLVEAHQTSNQELIVNTSNNAAKILNQLSDAKTEKKILAKLLLIGTSEIAKSTSNKKTADMIDVTTMTNGHAIDLVNLLGLN
jgi:hypothetical protein